MMMESVLKYVAVLDDDTIDGEMWIGSVTQLRMLMVSMAFVNVNGVYVTL